MKEWRCIDSWRHDPHDGTLWIDFRCDRCGYVSGGPFTECDESEFTKILHDFDAEPHFCDECEEWIEQQESRFA